MRTSRRRLRLRPPPKKGRVTFVDEDVDPYVDIFASGFLDEDMPPVSDSPIVERAPLIAPGAASVSPAVPSAPAAPGPPLVSSSLTKGQLKKLKKKKKGGR